LRMFGEGHATPNREHRLIYLAFLEPSPMSYSRNALRIANQDVAIVDSSDGMNTI